MHKFLPVIFAPALLLMQSIPATSQQAAEQKEAILIDKKLVDADNRFGLRLFHETLTPENWNSWLPKFTWKQGDLALPRFRFEYSADLNDMLQTLGMGVAFDPQRADFSNLITDGGIWISKAKHKTFVSVDVRGTEAAAATEIVLSRGIHNPPREQFRMVIDRPFFCAIRDDLTGAIPFLGTVVDPKT